VATDSDFLWIYRFTARWERGDHHPTLADPNPTHDGVTQRTWDALAKAYGWRQCSVFDLTPAEVIGVFRVIWTQSKALQLPRLLAGAHFDFSVNTSGPRANQTLQRAIGGVDVDGVIGPQTLAAALSKPSIEVTRRYMGFREQEYRELAENKPHLKPNLKGWLNRCTDLREYLGLS
jgi:lysozyme family protein